MRKDRRARAKRVHSLVNQAIKKGDIHKPSVCEVCDQEKHLEGHHPNYNLPYDLIWACQSCHNKIHKYCEVVYS